MALPDFLVVGAMKCGTTTLAAQLAAQPGVFMTTPKEPNFFSDDPVYARGMGWYESLFDEAAPGDLKGEASTHYTKLPTYPQTLGRMREALPDVRLVYMIRNPVARAVSHYIHGWSRKEMGHDPVEAVRTHPEIVDYGRYGHQIAPFVDAYGADRIRLTSLERLTAEPEAEFARLADFLGLGDRAAWVHDLPAQNVSSERVRPLPLHGLLVDNPVATALRRALVPKSLRSWVRRVRSIRDRPDLPETLRREMETTFLADRAELAAHFPGHPALDDCYPFAPR